MGGLGEGIGTCPAVVPVLVGPLQVLLTILPGLLLALGGGLLALFKPSGMKNALRLLWRQKIAVACAVLISAGLYFGARQVWPRGWAGVVGTAQAGIDWPTTRFDERRCGVAPGSPSPTRPQLVWTHRSGAEGYFASPAVVGNRVYIASAELGISKSGSIYCLDADTGAVVWNHAPPDYRPTFSSPVIAGDYLVCGEGLHDTRDARVVCLDLREQGKVAWTFRTKNHVECTPVIADGRVYVGAGDDGVYCLDLKPGSDGQAKLHWRLPPERFPDAETSLAVFDGRVYVGLGNAGAALVVLDAVSGDELHRLPMPYPVFSPASFADGKLYLGMGNGDYVVSGEGGAVHCLDLKTMKTDWTFPLPQTVLGAIAIKDNRLYFGCNDGQVYCLSRAGKLIKSFNTRAPIKTSPAVTDDHVFAVNGSGLLYALDRHSLEPIWDYRLGASDLFISSPVVARGHVYVGTQAEGLLCIGKPPSSKHTPHWFTPLGGPGVAGNSDSSSLPEAGEVHWSYPPATPSRSNPVVAPVAIWGEHLYVARTGDGKPGLECLPLVKDSRDLPKPLWSFVTETGVWTSPVVLGKHVACVDGEPGAARRTMYLVDRESGALVKRAVLSPNATGLLTATTQQFLIQDGAEQISSYDMAGHPQWSAVVGRLACVPVANDALIVAVAKQPKQLVALDRATGMELWRTALASEATATPLLEKKTLLLPTRHGLELRSLIDGEALSVWPVEVGVPSGELALANALVVFVNHKGEVVTMDRGAGTVAAPTPGGLPGQTPLISRGKLLFAASGRLMSLALGQENPTPELWMDLSEAAPKEGLPVGPLVLHDSRIFTVVPGRGLVCLGRLP